MRGDPKKLHLIGVCVTQEVYDQVMALVEAEQKIRPRARKSTVCHKLLKIALREVCFDRTLVPLNSVGEE